MNTNQLPIPLNYRKHRKSKTFNFTRPPIEIKKCVTYTKFIQNLKNLLKYPQKYKKRFFKSKSKQHNENALFLVIRKYIIETMTYEGVVKVLQKGKHFRTKQEIKAIAEFLALKNDFFNKLKESNQSTLYAVVNVLNIETYNKDETIINCGEEGDKFYVVLEGKVAVYKPKRIEKEMTVKDFISYLRSLKFNSIFPYVLQRVEDYNKLTFNISHLKENNYDYKCVDELDMIRSFVVEEYIKVFEGGEGTSFGEVALIQKTTRNATIIAQTQTNIASLDKEDYHDLMRIIEAKKYYERISQMKRNYLIVRSWTNQTVIRLINNLVTYEKINGDVIYHQGDICDGIYFVSSGKLEIAMEVNDDIIEQMKSYIKLNVQDLYEWIESFKGKKIPKENIISDFIKHGIENGKEFPIIKKHKGYIDKIILRKVNANECFGLEDAFELKKRFYSVTCVSLNAQIQKIQMTELVNILLRCNQDSLNDIKQYIQEKKHFILTQIRNYFKVKQNDITKINTNEQSKLNDLFENNQNSKEKRHNIKMNIIIDKISDGAFKQKPISFHKKIKSDDTNNGNGICSYFKQISPKKHNKINSLYSCYYHNTTNSNSIKETKTQKAMITTKHHPSNILSRNRNMKTVTATTSYSVSSLSPCKNNNNKNCIYTQITPNLKKNISHVKKCSSTISNCRPQQCLYKSYQNGRICGRNKTTTIDISSKLTESEKCNTQIYNNVNNNNCVSHGRTLSEEKMNCLLTEGYQPIKKISHKEIMKMAGVYRSYRRDTDLNRKIMFPQVCVISPLFSNVTEMNTNNENAMFKRRNKFKLGSKTPVKVVFHS